MFSEGYLLERFSKPNFGSIRRFRTMTGLEIENWIEKCGRTVRKFRSTRPRTESNFRFGLTSCGSQNLPTEVRLLLCQVFDSFSLVTSSSSHHASHLRGFIRSLTRPNWSFHSTRLTMNFFTSAGDFRQVDMAIISEWMGKRCWPLDHQWSRTWQKESPGLAPFDKEHYFGTQGPRFSSARHQSSSAGHAIMWSIVFLFAERNFRLCLNRNFDTIFDPVLPEPNRILGLLNLSIYGVLRYSILGIYVCKIVWYCTGYSFDRRVILIPDRRSARGGGGGVLQVRPLLKGGLLSDYFSHLGQAKRRRLRPILPP